MAELKRELKLLDVFSIAAGAMISSGLFILPGLAYFKSGPSEVLAYFLASILVFPGLLSKAELATAMPRSGGDYFFVDRSLGSGFGTLAGISAWFSVAFKSAFALLGIGAFGTLLYPELSLMQIKLISIVFCLIFTYINLTGVRHAGKTQVILVLFLLGLLGIFIFRGLPVVKIENFAPFFKGDFKSMFITAGLIFVSYGGLTKVASIAEEIENPTRNIPLGMMLAYFIVTIIYVVVVFITVGINGESLLRPSPMNYSLTPITDTASKIMGLPGIILLSVAAILAFISTANAGIMAASRTPLAMGRDGLIPPFLAKVNRKYKTPHIAILFTSVFIIIVILFLDLELLVKTASTIMIILFGFVNISVIIMRESGIQNYRPKFKTPLYPWMQIFGVLSYLILIIAMGKTPLMITSIFIILGLIWYWFYGRIRTNKESALFHIVQRVKDSALRTPSLETELKEIVRERDDIKQDRFDRIIENCPVIDIDKKLTKDEFFNLIAEKLCDSVEKSCKYLASRLQEREAESSTALTEHLAIPHLIIDGEGQFNILMARSRKGIFFSAEAPEVKIVFVIAGTKDERTYHLKALAAIAQIVQNRNFEDKWLAAKNEEELRDLILLGERQRN